MIYKRTWSSCDMFDAFSHTQLSANPHFAAVHHTEIVCVDSGKAFHVSVKAIYSSSHGMAHSARVMVRCSKNMTGRLPYMPYQCIPLPPFSSCTSAQSHAHYLRRNNFKEQSTAVSCAKREPRTTRPTFPHHANACRIAFVASTLSA